MRIEVDMLWIPQLKVLPREDELVSEPS